MRPREVLAVFDRIERDAAGVRYHYVIVDYLLRLRVGRRCGRARDAEDVAWVAPGTLGRPTTCRPQALEVVRRALAARGGLIAPAASRGTILK